MTKVEPNVSKLLIVDDEEALARGLASVLQNSTLDVTVCTNAVDGLDKLKTEKFDCIVSDISMPVMNGVEFLKNVRDRGIEIPFIIYTGFGTDELALEASRYGCFEFIEKPLMTGLLEAIKRAIKQNAQMKDVRHEDKLFDEVEELLEELKGE